MERMALVIFTDLYLQLGKRQQNANTNFVFPAARLATSTSQTTPQSLHHGYHIGYFRVPANGLILERVMETCEDVDNTEIPNLCFTPEWVCEL